MEQQIGTLAVLLKLDGKQFEKTVQTNTAKMKDFKVQVSQHVATIAKVTAATFAGMGAAVGVVLRNMIDDAAKLGAMSQELGTTTESLSAMRYAAEQANVPFEVLTASMTKLNQALGAIAGGTAENMPAAQALTALGISATDATGKIKSSSDVMVEVAQKFATYRDGANKAALAIALFGEQGVKLTPLLNRGREGIAALTAEAERLGVVIDTDTARTAQEFNEVMGKLEASGKGVAIALGERLLPDLKILAEAMQGATSDTGTLGPVLDGVALGFKTVASAAIVTAANITMVGGSLRTMVQFARDFVNVGWDEALMGSAKNATELAATLAGMKNTVEQLWGAGNQEDSPFFTLGAKLAEQSAQVPKAVAPAIQAATDLTAQFTAGRAAARSMLDDLINSPTADIATKIAAITQAARDGTIGFNELGRTMRLVTEQQNQLMSDAVTATTGALNAVFDQNKGVAISTALINTYQAITKALSSAPPPFNYALAAGVAAQGFAQVKAIRGTNREYGGPVQAGQPYVVGEKRPELFVPSQNGHIVPSLPSAHSRDAAGGNVTLTVKGFNVGQFFEGDRMRDIAEKMLAFQRNGGRVVFA